MGASVTSGDLITAIVCVGQVTASGSASADLTTSIPFSAEIDGAATCDGALSTTIGLAADIIGTSGAAANLTTPAPISVATSLGAPIRVSVSWTDEVALVVEDIQSAALLYDTILLPMDALAVADVVTAITLSVEV